MDRFNSTTTAPTFLTQPWMQPGCFDHQIYWPPRHQRQVVWSSGPPASAQVGQEPQQGCPEKNLAPPPRLPAGADISNVCNEATLTLHHLNPLLGSTLSRPLRGSLEALRRQVLQPGEKMTGPTTRLAMWWWQVPGTRRPPAQGVHRPWGQGSAMPSACPGSSTCTHGSSSLTSCVPCWAAVWLEQLFFRKVTTGAQDDLEEGHPEHLYPDRAVQDELVVGPGRPSTLHG